MTRNIIDIDLDSCIGCHSCAVVCKQENNVGLGTFYNKVLTVGSSGTYPDLEMYYLPVSCQHCDNPECVSVCPTGAPSSFASSEKEYCVFAMQTGHSRQPSSSSFCSCFNTFPANSTFAAP